MTKTFKCRCPHCHKFIDFPSHGEGRTIGCPHCGNETILRAWSPEIAEAAADNARLRRVFSPGGVGCVGLVVGVLLLVFFPVGTIAGVLLLIWSVKRSKQWACSRCGANLADPSVNSCPTCKSEWVAEPSDSAQGTLPGSGPGPH